MEVNPAKPYNARRAWDIRARNSVKELGLPKTLETVVFSAIEQELAPEAHTLAIFAAVETYSKRVEMDVVRIPLHIDLPIVDLVHSRVEARWGELYDAPLLYALDEYERVGIVWLRGEGWKFFEVFLGEIEEHTEVFRDMEPEVWKELQAFDPGRVRSLAQARTSGSRDRFSQRMEAHGNGCTSLSKAIGRLDRARRCRNGDSSAGPAGPGRVDENLCSDAVPQPARDDRGPDLRSTAFASFAGRGVGKSAARVNASGAGARAGAPPADQRTAWCVGLDPTLDALQAGRLSVLVAPWQLDEQVWVCSNGLMAGTKQAASLFCDGDQPQCVALRDVVVDACAAYATRLEFVSGPAAEQLTQEMKGIAGLFRW